MEVMTCQQCALPQCAECIAAPSSLRVSPAEEGPACSAGACISPMSHHESLCTTGMLVFRQQAGPSLEAGPEPRPCPALPAAILLSLYAVLTTTSLL